jgi:tetratricopeptide (TPR) repeat protein
MDNTNTVAITELIKKLHYENVNKLSDKVREVLEEKEHFSRYVTTESSKNEQGGQRPEKCEVSLDAEVLVDNICFLQQYPYLFGKAKNSDQYPPYKKWKHGIDEAEFNANLNKLKKRLEKNIERSSDSLKSVNNFASFVLTNKKIDLEEKRLSSMVLSSNIIGDTPDASRAFELGTWNELLELHEQLDQGEETSLLYQQIGEKFLQLGESEQAKEALDNSLELDSQNGVAWALLSIISYDYFNKARAEYNSAMIQTDYAGEVVNPISAEEHWINQRVDETATDYVSAERHFSFTAINALKFWPEWPSSDNSRSWGKSYTPCLSLDGQSQIKMKRELLFKNLIISCSFSSLAQSRDDFIQVVRDFQSNDPELYPLTSVYYFSEFSFKEAVIEKLLKLSPEDEVRVVGKLVELCENSGAFQEWPIKLLDNPLIRRSLMRVKGVHEYSNLIDKLNTAQYHYRKQKKADAMAKQQLEEFTSFFEGCKPKFRKLENERWLASFEDNQNAISDLKLTVELQNEFISAFMKANKIALNWSLYTEMIEWNEYRDISNPISDELPTLVFLSLVSLGLTNSAIKEEELLYLRRFIDNHYVLMNVVSNIDSRLFNSLFLVEILESQGSLETEVLQLLYESILEVREKLAQQEALEFD